MFLHRRKLLFLLAVILAFVATVTFNKFLTDEMVASNQGLECNTPKNWHVSLFDSPKPMIACQVQKRCASKYMICGPFPSSDEAQLAFSIEKSDVQWVSKNLAIWMSNRICIPDQISYLQIYLFKQIDDDWIVTRLDVETAPQEWQSTFPPAKIWVQSAKFKNIDLITSVELHIIEEWVRNTTFNSTRQNKGVRRKDTQQGHSNTPRGA